MASANETGVIHAESSWLILNITILHCKKQIEIQISYRMQIQTE